ncbi:MAG: amidohydrolase family protein [Candidatus Omnitrophota bacterium]|nr:amidohydrolase family protein [Candidatus Omnitrophota bacterium]
MIIDAHSHYLPEEIVKVASFYNPNWTDIEAQLKGMEESGVEKAILHYPTTDAHIKLSDEEKAARLYNDGLSKVTRKYPHKFIGLGVLPVQDKERMLYELKRCRKDLGLRGISLAASYNGIYLDDKRFYPLYEEAQGENLPIFVHTQTINPIGFERVNDPLLTPVVEYVFDMTMCVSKMMMSGVFVHFPGLKFIFAHFGGVLPFLKDRFDTVYTMLRMRNIVKDLGKAPSEIFKNIYCDTSAVKSKNVLKMALDTFGAEHLLWGSDYPANKDVQSSIKAIRELDAPDEQKELMLGMNIGKIISLDVIV